MKRTSFKLDYDETVDAAYLTLSRGRVLKSKEVETGIVFDFGANDRIRGIEILHFTRRFERQRKVTKNPAR